ncbi:coiled-coil domain-containing protein [Avrilella dinanensis]|nr:hypothetical protein [Avrilella dinanensis]
MSNSEIKKLWERLVNLENNHSKLSNFSTQLNSSITNLKQSVDLVSKTTPEYEKEAQQASRKTSEYRNKANDTLDEAKSILDQIKVSQNEITELKTAIMSLNDESKNEFTEFREQKEEVDNLLNELQEKIELIQSSIKLYEETVNNHPDLEDEISELETNISTIKDNESKSAQLVKSITNRKVELETLYNEILGYGTKDEETDEEIFVEGLKQELEESLDNLTERTQKFANDFQKLETTTNDNVNNLLQVNSDKIFNQIQEWEEKFNALNKKIESLLPNALTAGLSHAFSSKKKDEDISYEKHKKQFSYGIIGMVVVSLIPFIISLVTLLANTDIDTVINRMPKLVVAILPLYVPVLWLSISSSKKMNLSKRLIEEYTHKEVLSKTFEGLSRQIQDLGDDEISNDLKNKLLQDFLQMYSENPGKLISDYNSSDHPIMELLENSNKLEKTISKLEKVPGMQKVATLLEKKSEKKLEQATELVEKSIDRVLLSSNKDNLEEDDEETV